MCVRQCRLDLKKNLMCALPGCGSISVPDPKNLMHFLPLQPCGSLKPMLGSVRVGPRAAWWQPRVFQKLLQRFKPPPARGCCQANKTSGNCQNPPSAKGTFRFYLRNKVVRATLYSVQEGSAGNCSPTIAPDVGHS